MTAKFWVLGKWWNFQRCEKFKIPVRRCIYAICILAVIGAQLKGCGAAWGWDVKGEMLKQRGIIYTYVFIYKTLWSRILLFSHSSALQGFSRQVFLCVGINPFICRSNFYKRNNVMMQIFVSFLISFPCLQQVPLLSLTFHRCWCHWKKRISMHS